MKHTRTGVANRMHAFTIPSRGSARATTCPQIGGGVLVLAKPVCWLEQGVARDLDAYNGALLLCDGTCASTRLQWTHGLDVSR